MMRQSKVRILAECAMMLALSIALSFVVLYEMPWGGAVTLLSMLPVMLVSIRHGLKWGLTTSFLYAWFQALQGKAFSLGGVSPWFLIIPAPGLPGRIHRFGTCRCVPAVRKKRMPLRNRSCRHAALCIPFPVRRVPLGKL